VRQSITQEYDYGCGVACFAFALGINYKKAVILLGKQQSSSNRFYVKDLTNALNKSGENYISKYVKPHIRNKIYKDGSIVLIKRSKHYPTGHYLIRYNELWMDPWINLRFEKNIKKAKSGFRKKLPGTPMYVIIPHEGTCHDLLRASAGFR
jgi:hypothetical protein